MHINTQYSQDDQRLVLAVNGRFDFSLANEFRQAYESYPEARQTLVDLRHVEFLDSSALAMLLNMRAYRGGDQADIRIANCSPNVAKVFRIARFDRLFKFD